MLKRARLAGVATSKRCLLFLVARFRRAWPELLYEGSQRAVEALERRGDGLIGEEEWRRAVQTAEEAARQGEIDRSQLDDFGSNASFTIRRAAFWAGEIAEAVSHPDIVRLACERAWGDFSARAENAAALRDIFGPLPFRFVDPPDPGLWTWNNGTISSLVRAISQDRAFDHLPILADALEEAGCTNLLLIDHCRSPGPHVHGCWAVDFLSPGNDR
jgi:hypothetical protein